MDLNELVIFVRVVQAGSLRAAAAQLGMPKSTVSRKLMALEERLDARLLQRTTRKLGLTDAGRIYYDHGLRIVADLENADQAVRSQQETPRGLLRVTAPLNLAFIGPVIRDYLERHPQVRLELSANARVVDLIEEGFDLGLRIGPLEDSSLIARPLGTARWLLAAAPAYLARRRHPQTVEELQQHDCLLFGSQPVLVLTRAGLSRKLTLTPRLLVTDMDVLQNATLGGLGIAALPEQVCAQALQTGQLEQVLPGWCPPSTPVHVVYPSRRHLSPTARSFIDHLARAAVFPLHGPEAEAPNRSLENQ